LKQPFEQPTAAEADFEDPFRRLRFELLQSKARHRRADPVEPRGDQPAADPAARPGELAREEAPQRYPDPFSVEAW
jgi:hypothetical protein